MPNKCFLVMPKTMASDYKFSIYNIYLDETKGLVYNTITQAVSAFEDKALNVEDIAELLECGFVVEKSVDELAMLKKEYDCREQLSSEFHLIIATTLDCQFRCFYCYEQHPKVYMGDEVKQSIVNLVKKQACAGMNISIVWYGGEPMLDFHSIRELSYRFMTICENYNVNYRASMISNGYLFNRDNISHLDSLRINSIQITLDGMKEIHEKRRPMIDGRHSFERIIENMILIKQISHVQLHLRINVDKKNIDSAHNLLEYCFKRGLQNIDVNLGMMKAFGCDHTCGSCDSSLFSMKEFSREFLKFRDYAKKLGFVTAVEKMTLEYKVNSCTLDAPNAYVVDPYGFVYKCISLVGQEKYSIGNVQTVFDENAHNIHNPFIFPMCTSCKYFPVCKGGCLLNNEGRAKECNIWRFVSEDLILRDIGC